MKKEYDLIVSLGENCMVAHNLRYRKMRPFSLPFDWVYMEDDKTLRYLIEGFNDKFANLLLRKNIRKITGNDAHKIIYKDDYSGYCFPNHFEEETLTDNEYEKVYNKLRMRINRLFDYLEKSNSILFILAGTISFEKKDILELKKVLSQLYPAKEIDFRIMIFDSDSNEEESLDANINIYKYKRPTNLYDFAMTNYEWEFLDNIKLSHSLRIINREKSIKIFSMKINNKRFMLDFSWKNLTE